MRARPAELPDGAAGKAEFVRRFRMRLADLGAVASGWVAASYFRERRCEPGFSPEDWAEAHFIYGDDA